MKCMQGCVRNYFYSFYSSFFCSVRAHLYSTIMRAGKLFLKTSPLYKYYMGTPLCTEACGNFTDSIPESDSRRRSALPLRPWSVFDDQCPPSPNFRVPAGSHGQGAGSDTAQVWLKCHLPSQTRVTHPMAPCVPCCKVKALAVKTPPVLALAIRH